MLSVYHGTRASNVDTILEQGIKPRCETDQSNWSDSEFESISDHVYITSTYGIFFGMCSARNTDENIAVFDIDLNRLNSEQLYPDEDYIEQAIRMGLVEQKWSNNEELSVIERTEKVRKNIEQYKNKWDESIDNIGNLAHKKRIPTHAIKRVSVLDTELAPNSFFSHIDPTITIQNAQLAGGKYRLLTEIIFDENVSVKELCMRLTFPFISSSSEGQNEQFEEVIKEHEELYKHQERFSKQILNNKFWTIKNNPNY